MTILFITPTYKPAYVYGGVTVVTSLLAESLAKNGHDVTVYTTNANGASDLKVKTGQEVIVDGVKVIYFKRLSRGHSNISPAIWNKIFRNVKNFDIVHLHSWWNPTIVIAAVMCKLRGVKTILSPHGMLCDYILNTNNRGKKQLLHYFIGKSLLQNAFLHVSTDMEWNESQAFYNGKWTGAVIPNLVQLDQQSKSRIPPKDKASDLFTIGFLSRIDPKKGVDILIEALSKVNFPYRLKIAGTGNRDYMNSLKQLSVKLGNASSIEWVGWKGKKQKQEFYSSIDLLALTSLNENFAVVVIEALSAGTPVLVSDQVGLSGYVDQKQLGWVTKISHIQEVVSSFEKIYSSKEKLAAIKLRAPGILAIDFNEHYLANKYLTFYQETSSLPKKISSFSSMS